MSWWGWLCWLFLFVLVLGLVVYATAAASRRRLRNPWLVVVGAFVGSVVFLIVIAAVVLLAFLGALFGGFGGSGGSGGNSCEIKESPLAAVSGRALSGWIAFARGPEGHSDIWLLRASDGKLRRLTNDRAYDSDPLWSPDGRKLAWIRYINGRASLVVAPVGGHGLLPRRLLRPATQLLVTGFSWAPEGTRIAVSSPLKGRVTIAIVDLASGDARGILPDERTAAYKPAWSPDGRLIAFDEEVPVKRGHGRVRDQIVVVRTDGSGRRVVATKPGGIASPSWSHDGDWIAAVTDRLFLARPDGSRLRSFETRDYPWGTVSWSPNDKMLIYDTGYYEEGGMFSYSSGDSWIGALNIRDGDTRPLTSCSEGRYDMSPAWSPSGAFVAFVSKSVSYSATVQGRVDLPPSRGDIFVTRAGAGELKQLTASRDVYAPLSWQPRGS